MSFIVDLLFQLTDSYLNCFNMVLQNVGLVSIGLVMYEKDFAAKLFT